MAHPGGDARGARVSRGVCLGKKSRESGGGAAHEFPAQQCGRVGAAHAARWLGGVAISQLPGAARRHRLWHGAGNRGGKFRAAGRRDAGADSDKRRARRDVDAAHFQRRRVAERDGGRGLRHRRCEHGAGAFLRFQRCDQRRAGHRPQRQCAARHGRGRRGVHGQRGRAHRTGGRPRDEFSQHRHKPRTRGRRCHGRARFDFERRRGERERVDFRGRRAAAAELAFLRR